MGTNLRWGVWGISTCVGTWGDFNMRRAMGVGNIHMQLDYNPNKLDYLLHITLLAEGYKRRQSSERVRARLVVVE